MTTKTTTRQAITYVLDNFDLPTNIREKFEAMIVALDKKASADRKPTAKQTANEGIRAAIVEFINDNYADNDGFTCSDLIKQMPLLADKSNQYVSAIMRQAVLANEVSKGTVKRHTYFAPVGVYEDKGE